LKVPWQADDTLRGPTDREFQNFSATHAHFVRWPRFLFVAGTGVSCLLQQQPNQTRKERERKRGIMNLETLKELYVNELRDLYNAENQLIKALPKMAKGASSDELKEAFEKHLEQTKGHVQRLEEVFQQLGEKTKGKTCQAMKGLIEEGSEVLKADGDDSVIDAAIIVAAQKVEHYEIAGYGSVRTFAQLLGQNKSAELLQQTLDEESEANELLNKLAEDIVNPEALMEPEMASASSDR
jgi:ferritin-like metal-binding protein YciE